MLPLGTNLKIKKVPYVTISLIALNVLFYILDLKDPRFFYSLFSHANFPHLFGNMLFLWIFGSTLEGRIGWKQFLFFYLLSYIGAKSLFLVIQGGKSIGASGAISGVMGLYLVRCHYAKVTTMVPIGLMFFRFQINAKWLLLFWLTRDVYHAYTTVDFIAQWSHIGGFFTGIIIGFLGSYGTEGRKEHLYESSVEAIERGVGLDEAEKNLQKALEMEPHNPELHLQLARACVDSSKGCEKGKKHYLKSAQLYYQNEMTKSMSGEVLAEYLHAFDNNPISPATHFKCANALYKAFDYKKAVIVLEPFITEHPVKGGLGEQVIRLYIRSAIKGGLIDLAKYGHEVYLQRFPESPFLEKIGKAIESYKPPRISGVEATESETLSAPMNILSRMLSRINEITSDPMYMLLVSLTLYFSLAFFGIYGLFFTISLAFLGTLISDSVGSFFGMIFTGTGKEMTDAEAEQEFNIKMNMEKANRNAINGDYNKVEMNYLEVLKHDDNHLDARHGLAKLYCDHLNNGPEALKHFKIASRLAPDTSMLKESILQEIKNLVKNSAIKTKSDNI